mgnify:CR=1 FL=1
MRVIMDIFCDQERLSKRLLMISSLFFLVKERKNNEESIPLFLIPLAETAGVNASRSSDKQFAQFVKKSLGRYFLQDWGEMCEEDKKANNWSLNHDERILASYSDKENDYKIWIITEADRSITTILFPDEY